MAQLQQFYYHQDPVVRKYLELNNEDGYGPAGTKWFKLVGDFDFDSLCSTLPPKPLLPLNKVIIFNNPCRH